MTFKDEYTFLNGLCNYSDNYCFSIILLIIACLSARVTASTDNFLSKKPLKPFYIDIHHTLDF